MDKPEVVILCGGKGTRLMEETIAKPKPMVEVGGKPILWHIMKIYAHYGFNRFVLALGYRGEYIKEYFYHYRITSGDFTLDMDPHKPPEIHDFDGKDEWEITFIDTGQKTHKGGRIKQIEKYVKSDNFHLTYGDGVANVDMEKLHDFHLSHGDTGTVTAVRPPSRFGEVVLSGDKVKKFEEKPQLGTGVINGGFFVFNKDFFDYLTPDEDCDFEFGPLEKLAKDGKLRAYNHAGFWYCMDNIRDREYLNKLYENNKAKWVVWK